ncbi:MAG: helix-turn-helix transcriptional regulator [Acidobacteria bacterium]|nr:helix-turn-helix transcriptional regulator [Acidobacteriota bacterium]
MTQRSFGQMVREARLERHLSMGQLAAAVDRSTASVRRWERDEGLPSEDAIETLILRLGLDRADALDVHRDVGGQGVQVGHGDLIGARLERAGHDRCRHGNDPGRRGQSFDSVDRLGGCNKRPQGQGGSPKQK